MPRRVANGRGLTKRDYEALANFRYALRHFFAFSETAAAAVGLSAQQHQAMLAIKGTAERDHLSIGEIADRLEIRHHSAVELVKRLEKSNLAQRKNDPSDGRKVHIYLTRKADKLIEDLSQAHINELRNIRPVLQNLIRDLKG